MNEIFVVFGVLMVWQYFKYLRKNFRLNEAIHFTLIILGGGIVWSQSNNIPITSVGLVLLGIGFTMAGIDYFSLAEKGGKKYGNNIKQEQPTRGKKQHP